MPRRRARIASRALVLILVSLFSLARFAYAESVAWNASAAHVCNPASCGTYGLSSVQMQVSYYVQVTNADTGQVLKDGDTVPAGTHVKYQFVPHDYSHIYWFSAGYNADSPARRYRFAQFPRPRTIPAWRKK